MIRKPNTNKSLRVLTAGVLAFYVLGSLTGCTSTKAASKSGSAMELGLTRATNTESEESDEVPENFNYCPVESIKKSADDSAGLAALTSVLKYWDAEASEPELVKDYPSDLTSGHSMNQLQRIAIDKGLTAFALTMKNNPLEHLTEQLEHGRPILVTVRFPDGTYFGKSAADITQIARDAGSTSATAPVINKDQEHYVVVFGQSEKQFLLMDPTFGVLSIDKESFVKYWKEVQYSALLCST